MPPTLVSSAEQPSILEVHLTLRSKSRHTEICTQSIAKCLGPPRAPASTRRCSNNPFVPLLGWSCKPQWCYHYYQSYIRQIDANMKSQLSQYQKYWEAGKRDKPIQPTKTELQVIKFSIFFSFISIDYLLKVNTVWICLILKFLKVFCKYTMYAKVILPLKIIISEKTYLEESGSKDSGCFD